LTRGGNATYPAPRPLVPIELEFCPGCNCFVREEEAACPFCGGDLAALREEDQAHRRRVVAAMDHLRTLLAAQEAVG
jgi:hypothetical protein